MGRQLSLALADAPDKTTFLCVEKCLFYSPSVVNQLAFCNKQYGLLLCRNSPKPIKQTSKPSVRKREREGGIWREGVIGTRISAVYLYRPLR